MLERGNGPEPDSLDPARAQGLSAHQVLRDLYEGLVIEDRMGALLGGAAQSWEARGDGLSYRFLLRPDLKFSDGSPLTAADFVTALNRALDPQTGAPYATLLLPIAGAKRRLQGEPAALGVLAVDATTLTIDLDQPCPDLPARLSLPLASPVRLPPAGQPSTGRTLLGNGPYRLRDWQPGAWVELEANPHWRDAGTLAIRRVRFHVTEDAAQEARRFAAGELHLTETIPPQPLAVLRARFGPALRIAPSYGTFFLGLNLSRPPFAGAPGLREALGLAIDRELLVRLVTGAGEQPAWRLVPPAADAFVRTPARAAALARARQLYAAAGYHADRPLQVELRYNSSSQNRRLMLAIAAMWREQLGVRTRLRHEEWRVFVRNRRAKVLTQVFRGGWNADLVDPLNFLETFRSDSPLNATGFADAGFDQLLAAAQQSLEPASRAALLARAEAQLLGQWPIIPLYHYASRHLVDPRLEGFHDHPLDHHPTRWLRWRTDSGPSP